MIKGIKLFLLTNILFLIIACQKRKSKSFSLSVEYYSSWAYPVKYNLNQYSLTVIGISSYKNLSKKVVYQHKLDDVERNKFYTILSSFRVDTLKELYEDKFTTDPLTTVIEFKVEKLKSKKITLIEKETSITDSLQRFMQLIIPDKRFRYDRYYDNF